MSAKESLQGKLFITAEAGSAYRRKCRIWHEEWKVGNVLRSKWEDYVR